MEPISAVLVTFGVILLLTSWIYLMIISFKADFSWGLCAVFVPVLAYIYAFFDWKKTQGALATAGIGWAAIIFALL